MLHIEPERFVGPIGEERLLAKALKGVFSASEGLAAAERSLNQRHLIDIAVVPKPARIRLKHVGQQNGRVKHDQGSEAFGRLEQSQHGYDAAERMPNRDDIMQIMCQEAGEQVVGVGVPSAIFGRRRLIAPQGARRQTDAAKPAQLSQQRQVGPRRGKPLAGARCRSGAPDSPASSIKGGDMLESDSMLF